MAQYRAAWLIGSYEGLPATSVTISGTPVAPTNFNVYLYDAGPGAHSLLTIFQGLMITAGLGGTLAIIQRNGLVYIEAGAIFSVSWGAAIVLRDLLGFTGNLAGAAHYTAPNKSPLLWMPGKPETPLAQRLGQVGHRVPTVFQAVSPYSGRAESVSHGTRTFARYLFPMVDTDLVVTTANLGGTYARWFDEVAVKSARWKLYRDVGEDPAGTSAANGDLAAPLGPYVYSNTGKSPAWTYEMSRGFERMDARADIEIRCHVVEEYA